MAHLNTTSDISVKGIKPTWIILFPQNSHLSIPLNVKGESAVQYEVRWVGFFSFKEKQRKQISMAPSAVMS